MSRNSKTNKYKVDLRGGVLRLNDRDFLFGHAKVEFVWVDTS